VFQIAGLSVAALMSLELAAFAHKTPARRTVVVQAEANEVAVLVTWTAPSGPMGRLVVAAATWGRKGDDVKTALKTFMTSRALATLRFEGNGKNMHFDAIQTKVNLDPGPLGRHTIAILATKKLPKTRPFVLSVSSAQETGATRLSWTNRAGKDNKIQSSHKSDTWTTTKTVTLTWAKP
jgi:hypothetical protein